MTNLVKRFTQHGIPDAPRRVARRLWLTNLFALCVAIANLVYVAFYLAVDPGGLWPLILGASLHCVVNLATPLLHRFGTIAGPAWLLGWAVIAVTFYAWCGGTDGGVQYYFMNIAVSAPFLFGPRRIALVLAFAVLSFAALLLAVMAFDTPALPMPPALLRQNLIVTLVIAVGLQVYGIWQMARLVDQAEAAQEREYERSENLLANLLPESIATRLKAAPERIIADDLQQVTILFADVAGFTPHAASMTAPEVVGFLNDIFTEFDRLTEAHGLEKIKTIGDAYMVAGGMPQPRADHAGAVAGLALDMTGACERLSAAAGREVQVRIGIHTGPAVAGVIGTRKFFYDVWGDTVNMAARMESHGEPARIQITAETRAALGDQWVFERRGMVEIKGKGSIETWWLTGRR